MLKRNWMNFIKNSGVVLAVVLAVIQLWSWVTAPRHALFGEVEFAAIRFPPTLNSAFEALHNQLDVESLNQLADVSSIIRDDDPDRVKEAIEVALSLLSWKLRSRTPHGVPRDVSELSGVYWVIVTNDGSSAVSEVRLHVPNAKLVQIVRPGKEPTSQPTTGLIDLDTLQPKESASLVVWTWIAPSPDYAHDIRLTHEKGIGSITVRAPASPFGQWIDRNWPYILMFLPVIVFWSVLIAIPVFQSVTKRLSESDAAEETEGEADDGDTSGAAGNET